jgi:hypothetical protein
VLALRLALGFLALPSLAAPWVQTTSLPDTYNGQSLAYSSGYLYQAGGQSGMNGVFDGINVFYAQVHSNGTIGSWNTTTPLPEPVFYHAGVAANGFVYVLGGEHLDLNDYSILITNTVYYAKINSDGSLGSWQTSNPLPDSLEFLSASAWNNQIYVIGGSDGIYLHSSVYSATIETDGSLSGWTTQAPLPVAIFTQAETANSFLYVLVRSGADKFALPSIVPTNRSKKNVSAMSVRTLRTLFSHTQKSKIVSKAYQQSFSSFAPSNRKPFQPRCFLPSVPLMSCRIATRKIRCATS